MQNQYSKTNICHPINQSKLKIKILHAREKTQKYVNKIIIKINKKTPVIYNQLNLHVIEKNCKDSDGRLFHFPTVLGN